MTPLVYILAASHSGSTLLAMLLNAHPEVCTAGELKATSLGDAGRYRCSCGAEARRCAFWARVSGRMARAGVEGFSITAAGTDLRAGASALERRLLAPLHRAPWLEGIRDSALAVASPRWRARLARVQRANAALAAAVCAEAGKRVIVDSSKTGVRLKYLLRNRALDVRVIRLIRDGRGVALAHLRPAEFADARDPRLRGGGAGGMAPSRRGSMEDAACEWRRSNEEAEIALAGLDRSRFTEVRYEALCAHPRATLRRLFEFARVDPEARVASHRAVEHHVIGNGMRLDATAEVRLDDRFRTELGPADLSAFERAAGALNRRYGYR